MNKRCSNHEVQMRARFSKFRNSRMQSNFDEHHFQENGAFMKYKCARNGYRVFSKGGSHTKYNSTLL